MEARGWDGTACVTLPKKIRPFKRRGVLRRELGVAAAATAAALRGVGVLACFFRRELFLPIFLFPICWPGGASLQQRMIFSKRKTWYSRSISDLVTVKMSSRRSSPKFSRWWPFQSSIREERLLTVWSFSARR